MCVQEETVVFHEGDWKIRKAKMRKNFRALKIH